MILEIKHRRIANELIRLVHECEAGMRQGVRYYRNAAAGNQPDAAGLLTRAARLPYRVEARITAAVARQGQTELNLALSKISGLTIADLITELGPLKSYSDTLKTIRQTGGTLDDIAARIEASLISVDLSDEAAPIPADYNDDF